MELSFKENNGPVDEIIENLINLAGSIRRPNIVREMILASIKAGQEDDGKINLKLMNTSLKEMRYSSKIFGHYRDSKKVAVFGSARTQADASIYGMGQLLGRKLSEAGYMVITGGGGGIMHAVNEGAGPEFSFGVNIRLPFEQKPNFVMEGNPKNIMFKYFFNRKVAFIKESDAAVLFPGGFGTLDEGMETLTLVQTGKRNPLPIILIDEPEGTYWLSWIRFLKKELLTKNYINESDLSLFERVDNVDDAIKRINQFYYRYHSLRYAGNRLIIRLKSPIDQHKIEKLNALFSDICKPNTTICLSGPLPEEIDEPEIKSFPRLVLEFNLIKFARLKSLLDEINRD
jgi:uncharacterized protein (TIGR00730 family)